mmetsp:Transcript_27098/g.19539  ORF Transcript_27098/g.19539 Transcript_27098/m.19539 type:complete len:83 (-) Transcript_27098:23-271(-)
MKVQINNWFTVASWNWGIQSQSMCTICRQEYEMPCPSCKYGGDSCPPVHGECGCHFHLHCICKWAQTNDLCPNDRKPWNISV